MKVTSNFRITLCVEFNEQNFLIVWQSYVKKSYKLFHKKRNPLKAFQYKIKQFSLRFSHRDFGGIILSCEKKRFGSKG